jgi:hypothetical protein
MISIPSRTFIVLNNWSDTLYRSSPGYKRTETIVDRYVTSILKGVQMELENEQMV